MEQDTYKIQIQRLYAALLPWQQQHDLLLLWVRSRVSELESLGGHWPMARSQTLSRKPEAETQLDID